MWCVSTSVGTHAGKPGPFRERVQHATKLVSHFNEQIQKFPAADELISEFLWLSVSSTAT